MCVCLLVERWWLWLWLSFSAWLDGHVFFPQHIFRPIETIYLHCIHLQSSRIVIACTMQQLAIVNWSTSVTMLISQHCSATLNRSLSLVIFGIVGFGTWPRYGLAWNVWKMPIRSVIPLSGAFDFNAQHQQNVWCVKMFQTHGHCIHKQCHLYDRRSVIDRIEIRVTSDIYYTICAHKFGKSSTALITMWPFLSI